MSHNLYSDINGQLVLSAVAAYASTDELVRRRYGVYETMLFRNGVLELEAAHWQRLWQGLQLLGFTIPARYSGAYFEERIRSLAAANNTEVLGRVRLQVLSDDAVPPYEPFFYIECLPLDPVTTQLNKDGLIAGVLPGYQKKISPQANLKISHNPHHLPAKAAQQQYGWDEVLLCNEKGNIIESAIASVFWIRDRVIYTPPLSEGCIAGTMRGWLISNLSLNGYRVKETPCTIAMVQEADELFLTNSIRPVRWVKQLDGTLFEHKMIQEIYQSLVAFPQL